MRDRVMEAFDAVVADDALLQRTAAFLAAGPAAPRRRAKPQRLLPAAAVLLVVLVMVAGTFVRRSALSPDAYVSIDVNPSIELGLSRSGRVVATHAFNADGAEVLDDLPLKGKPLESAVDALVSRLDRQGYLAAGPVTVTVQAGDREAQLLSAVETALSSSLSVHGGHSGLELIPVSEEVRATAHGCHVSPAKYLAIQELLEVDDEASLEAYQDRTIGEIQERTRQCRMHGGSGSMGGGHHGGGHRGGR